MAVFAVAVRQDGASPPDPLALKRAVQALLTVTFEGNVYQVPLLQIAVTVAANATSTLASYASSLGAARRLSTAARRLGETVTNANATSDWAVMFQVTLTQRPSPPQTLTFTLTLTPNQVAFEVDMTQARKAAELLQAAMSDVAAATAALGVVVTQVEP